MAKLTLSDIKRTLRDPQGATYKELVALIETLAAIIEALDRKVENAFISKLAELKPIKGDPGYTPQKGKDYFTEEDIREIVERVVKEAGEEIAAIATPVKGADYLTDEEVASLVREAAEAAVRRLVDGEDSTALEEFVASRISAALSEATFTVRQLEDFEREVRSIVEQYPRGGKVVGGAHKLAVSHAGKRYTAIHELAFDSSTFDATLSNGVLTLSVIGGGGGGGATQLNDLSDVTLTSPTAGQFLRHNGTVWVNETVSIPSALSDLSDVTITTPAAQQFLRYDGTAWVNETVSIPSALNDLSDVSLASPASGHFLRYNGTAWVNEAVSIPSALNDLSDVTITTPSSGDFLRYNGTAWINEAVSIPSSLNDLSDVFVSAPASGHLLAHDGTGWVNSGAVAVDTASGNLTVSGVVKLSDGSAAAPSLTFTNDTDTGIYRSGADTLRIVTAGTDRLTIDSQGRLGIGTTPICTLDVAGEAKFRKQVTIVTANYTLVSSDRTSIIEANSASALTVTLPANVFSAGDVVFIVKVGTGDVTIAAGAGLTLQDPNTQATITTQYDSRAVYFRSATEAVIV